MLIYATLALGMGFVLDLIVGDPHGWPHIVRWIGALINRLERCLYPLKNKRLGGALLVCLTLFVGVAAPAVILIAAYRASPWLFFALEALLCWQCLAVKGLRLESGKVYTALKAGDLQGARTAASMIVGRDTGALDEQGVTRAAVETVAENASDGVVAPMFYLMLGGAALGCLYKAVNTMDSMIGYKNERYIDFGRYAARLDDMLSFLPSRLCAVLMIAASWFGSFDAGSAIRVWKRDRRNHASPNSAQTEAVMAGALHIRLAGDAVYKGKLLEKPYIGDDIRPIEREDIQNAHTLLYYTAVLMIIIVLIVRGIVYAALRTWR